MYQHLFKKYLLDQCRKRSSTSFKRRWISASFSMRSYSMSVTPQSCLYDEEAVIRCQNLRPNEDVTLLTSVKNHKGEVFTSNLQYRADEKGCLDLTSSPALGGEFNGVFPMGPFCSVHSHEPGKEILSLIKANDASDVYELQLLSGHFSDIATARELPTDKVIATTTHVRSNRHPDVEKIAVKTGSIRGVLWLPPGDGPFPAVIDLYGSTGGLNTSRASMLASRGIAALSLAYLRYDDLPRDLKEFNISYFEEAVQYLLNHDQVLKPSIGVIGLSMGGAIGLAMATFIHEVDAAVCINSIPAFTNDCQLRVKDKVFPPFQMDPSKIEAVGENVFSIRNSFGDIAETQEALFPIEEADMSTKFLFITSEDDQSYDAKSGILTVIERLQECGRTNWKHLNYDGAGHLFNPPYFPLSKGLYHPSLKRLLYFGGDFMSHSKAEVEAWNEILEFFKTTLTSKKLKDA